MKSSDVIVAGAGLIGISVALELQRRGARVLLVDRGHPGEEASSAAAGMLAPADPETPAALRALAFESACLFPGYVQQLEASSGMKVDFRRQGTISLHELPTPPKQYQRLASDELSRLEPDLDSRGRAAFFVQEDCVDPALLVRAAAATASQNGVEIRSHCAVDEVRAQGGQIEVTCGAERMQTGAFVNCRGAWSGAPVKPRKGQSFYVEPARACLLQHVIVAPEVYMVPRSSGKVLIGATVEDVGYDKAVDREIVRRLHQAAAELVPELGSAKIVQSWAGLRPGSPDDLPLMGETEISRVFIASGHFRNGILLAPVTALIIADLVAGKPPAMDISAFSPLRFAIAPSALRK